MVDVPVVPVLPQFALVQYLSQVVMIGGAVLVLAALPQVRRAIGSLVDRVVDTFSPTVRNTSPAVADVEEELPAVVTSRREIDEFDLSVFDRFR